MTFQAGAAAFAADAEIFIDLKPRAAFLPANDVSDPEAGWATRNPDRAMLFLFVTPRDCAAVDELMAL